MPRMARGGQAAAHGCCSPPSCARCGPALAQTPDEAVSRQRSASCARPASPDKEAIVERLIASRPSAARASVLTRAPRRSALRPHRRSERSSSSNRPTRRSRRSTSSIPLTLKDAGSAPTDALTKIGTNNRLRACCRTPVARFDLAEPRPGGAPRAPCTKCCARSTSRASRCCASGSASKPTRASRRKSTPGWRWPRSTAATPQARLDGDRDARRHGCVRMCATGWRRCSRQVARRQLRRAGRSASGAPRPRPSRASISARAFYSGIETLFFGLSLGSVLVLVAIGLAITFGVMGVINMAHGELMMLGAYTTYVVQTADAGPHRRLDPGRHSGRVPRRRR